jgi:ankyrin repeat protein
MSSVDERDDMGNTPLMLAGLMGHKDVFSFLLKNKANVNARNKDGDNCVLFIVKNMSYSQIKEVMEFVKIILPEIDLKVKDRYGKTVFDYLRTSRRGLEFQIKANDFYHDAKETEVRLRDVSDFEKLLKSKK